MKMRKQSRFKKSFTRFGLAMVISTITLIGFVAFRFLDAQHNTEIATTEPVPVSQQVPSIESVDDVDEVTEQLSTAELDAIDSSLEAEFNF